MSQPASVFDSRINVHVDFSRGDVRRFDRLASRLFRAFLSALFRLFLNRDSRDDRVLILRSWLNIQCGATGALLCYLLSATLGPAVLLSSPKWTHRLDRWKEKINAQGDNLISYLIVLRWVGRSLLV